MGQVGLGGQELIRIFQRRIRTEFIRRENAVAIPASADFTILGGQPGSGKSGVLDIRGKEAKGRGATWVINADDFASFHPDYIELQKAHGIEAADLVRGVTSDWVKMTVAAAQERGVNVVFESTMRQPDVVRTTLNSFKDHGYSTHAVMLAVQPAISWQSNYYRRESLSLEGSLSRIATRESHDAALAGSLRTVEMIERDHAASSIVLVDRKNNILYENHLTPSGWAREPKAARTLEEIRTEGMTAEEQEDLLVEWDNILRMAAERHLRDGVDADAACTEISDIEAARTVYSASAGFRCS